MTVTQQCKTTPTPVLHEWLKDFDGMWRIHSYASTCTIRQQSTHVWLWSVQQRETNRLLTHGRARTMSSAKFQAIEAGVALRVWPREPGTPPRQTLAPT